MRITLKAARVNRGLTQNDVAQALGVTKKTVSSWENGKTVPNIDKIEAICALYGLKYDDIQWKA
jgi:DNA-binding XRE family transcriptional regulator